MQVNQAAFKVKEAGKKLVMSSKNMEKAEENLRYATLGFKEGVIATSNVLEAQTAWLSAHSEKIDAQIDVKLTEIYLKKSLGTLEINKIRKNKVKNPIRNNPISNQLTIYKSQSINHNS